MFRFPRVYIWGWITLFFLLPLWPQAARGEEAINMAAAPDGNRVILILMDRVHWQDILNAKTPNIQRLARAGAVGLVNPATAGQPLTENTYLTIGAGKKALANGGAGLAFSYGEVFNNFLAQDIYQGRTGNIPAQNNLFHLNFTQLIKINQDTNYGARVGALGEALKYGNIKSAVIGNADTDENFFRYGVTVAMDSLGLVAGGKVDREISLADPERPYGLRTNYNKVLQETLKQMSKARFLVIETGDTYRVDTYQNKLTNERLLAERNQALGRLDIFIGRLMESINLNQTRLVLLSPSPSAAALNAGHQLTPVIITGEGVQAGSMLTSDTTHRLGLLTLIDIAPAILNYFNISPLPEMNGGRVNWVPVQDNLSKISTMDQRLVFEYQNRFLVLLPLLGILVTLMLLGLFSLIFAGFPIKFSTQGYRFILLAVVLTPLAVLLIGFTEITSPWLEGGVILGIDILLAGLINILIPVHAYRIIWAYLLTALFIGADVLTGSQLMQRSPLGYDPIIGARFYGIGNEYMGILVGAALLGLVPWWDSRGSKILARPLLLGIFIFVIFLLGSPFWGANVGGTITAIAAFGLTYLKLSGKKLNWNQGAFLLISPLLMIGLFLLMDLISNNPPSHLSNSVHGIIKNGGGEMFRIITRKLTMNWQLFKIIGGFPVVLPVLGLLAWGWYKSRGRLMIMETKFPALGAAVRGILAGSLAALIFNDSGIIAAGAMILYLIPILIYINLNDKEVSPWNTAGLEIQG